MQAIRNLKGEIDSLAGAAKAQETLRTATEGTIAALQEQLDTFGMTAEAIAVWKLEQMGAAQGSIDKARGLAEAIEKAREQAIKPMELQINPFDAQGAAANQLDRIMTPLGEFVTSATGGVQPIVKQQERTNDKLDAIKRAIENQKYGGWLA